MSKRALFRLALSIGVCVLLALFLVVPTPVLFSQSVHSGAGVIVAQQAEGLHRNHAHMFLPTSSSRNVDPPASIAPVPLPGGDIVPPLGGLVHLSFPGPTTIGDDGIDIEPITITNFRGFSAVAMLGGTATDAMGNTFTVATDFRVMQGEYLSADGKHHRGTFVMI